MSKAIDKAAGAEREVVSEGSPIKRMIPGADQDKTGSWIKDNGRTFIPTETAPATPAAKEWEGYGTALSPSWEPIVLAMKPLDGTFAQNALKHSVAGLAIDATRVGVVQPESTPVPSTSCIASVCKPVACQDALRRIACVLRSCNIGDKTLSRSAGAQGDNQTEAAECDALLDHLYPNGVWCGLTLCEDEGSQSDCQQARHSHDELVRQVEEAAQDGPPSLADVLDGIGRGLPKSECNPECHGSGPLSKQGRVCTVSTLINLLSGSNTALYSSPPRKQGRWPKNCVFSHHPECVQVGMKRVKGDKRDGGEGLRDGGFVDVGADKGDGKPNADLYGDADGLETVEEWRCHEDCPVGMLDEQSGNVKGCASSGKKAGTGYEGGYSEQEQRDWYGDSGSASRFFYCAKASGKDRGNLPAEELPLFGLEEPEFRNQHPTVKPLELMRYLLTLLYPPSLDAVCLDPFAGSGTTGVAAKQMGRKCILIEIEQEYVEIAARRLEQNVLFT